MITTKDQELSDLIKRYITGPKTDPYDLTPAQIARALETLHRLARAVEGGIADVISSKKVWTIHRFLADKIPSRENVEEFARFVKDPDSFNPYLVTQFEGNVLLNEGITLMHTLMFSTGGTKWDNSNARLGVGDSSAAESATHTGLQAAVNKFWRTMEATYPSYAAQVSTFRSVYGSTEGNYSWQEFTVSNAANDAGDNLNRKISNQGTKTAGQAWTLTLTITWT